MTYSALLNFVVNTEQPLTENSLISTTQCPVNSVQFKNCEAEVVPENRKRGWAEMVMGRLITNEHIKQSNKIPALRCAASPSVARTALDRRRPYSVPSRTDWTKKL